MTSKQAFSDERYLVSSPDECMSDHKTIRLALLAAHDVAMKYGYAIVRDTQAKSGTASVWRVSMSGTEILERKE